MNLSNEKAIEIMHELQNKRYDHIAELQEACNKQLNTMIYVRRYHFTPDFDKEDFCSDIFEYVLRNCTKFDESRGGFSTWVNQIASSQYDRYYNNKKKWGDIVSLYQINNDDEEYCILNNKVSNRSCEDEFFAKDLYRALREEMEKLPADQEQAISLCRIQGFKPAEAARIMGCKPSDISRWLNRGVGKLKQVAEREDLSADNHYDRVA